MLFILLAVCICLCIRFSGFLGWYVPMFEVMDRSILSDTHPLVGQFGKKIVRGVGNSATLGDPPGHSATSSILLISLFGNNFVLKMLKRLNSSK